MPEGDTLHRTANALRPVLQGAVLRGFEAPRLLGDRPQPGTLIEGVDAVGKHLLIHFDGGLTLRTHLGMSGSWHLYAQGARWQKPRHLVRVLVSVDGWDAVCFSAPQVQTYRRDHPGGPLGTARDPVGHLGPDLCRPNPDLDEGLRRLAALPETAAEIADAIMDQRVVAGIGNVYKSEVLFRCRVHPFVTVADVPQSVRRELLATANKLLLRNLTTSRRTTTAGRPGSLAVYGRDRKPCMVCGAPIRVAPQGEQNRVTYWCPRCQPAGAVGKVGIGRPGQPGQPGSPGGWPPAR